MSREYLGDLTESLIELFESTDIWHRNVRIELINGKYRTLHTDHSFLSDAKTTIDESYNALQKSIK